MDSHRLVAVGVPFIAGKYASPWLAGWKGPADWIIFDAEREAFVFGT